MQVRIGGMCEGGLLLFACSDGRLMHVQRRVGSIMAHDGDAVHGVTRLVKGIRCRLLVGGSSSCANTQLLAIQCFESTLSPAPRFTLRHLTLL